MTKARGHMGVEAKGYMQLVCGGVTMVINLYINKHSFLCGCVLFGHDGLTMEVELDLHGLTIGLTQIYTELHI